jgi:acyl-CoA synthetase (AMP-forming)/AMP-acid ligase II
MEQLAGEDVIYYPRLPIDMALVKASAADERGNLIIDESNGVRLDGRALEAMVTRVAGGLRANGIARGDVVAWQAPNWHEVIVLYRAAWRLGAIAAPIHHMAGGAEIDLMHAAVEPKVWLSRDDVRGPE